MNNTYKLVIAALVLTIMLMSFFSQQSADQADKQRSIALKIQAQAEEQTELAESLLNEANDKIQELNTALEKCQNGD